MGYNKLSECTLTNDERVDEKDRIIARLLEDDTEFTSSEEKFIGSIRFSKTVTVSQLFWLRDINNKY